MVPRIPEGPATSDPTYIVRQAQQVSQAAPPKKKIPAERWNVQAASLNMLTEVQGPEDLPEICQTLAPLTK